MTDFQELVEETRNHLMTGQPDKLNVLDQNIDAVTDTVQLRYALDGIDYGSRLSINGETMFVLSKDGNTPLSHATVIRGYNNSPKTTHTAGDVVRVNPQFTDRWIMTKINQCITSLHGHGLWQIKFFEFTYIPSQSGYEITPTDFFDVWRVSYDYPGPERDWPILRKIDYTISQSSNSGDFSSGKSIIIHNGGYPGRLIRVAYKAPFTPLVNLTDDVQLVTGLPASANEIVPYGAAVRLLYGREVKRSFLNRQPEPRRQQEVPPGTARNSMLPLVQAYYDTIDREVRIQHARYPEQV